MKKQLEQLKSEWIEELKAEATWYKHSTKQFEFIHIKNKDDNKVFTMTFKTLPEDNSGISHIVEHAIGCASKKYPLIDTFNELDQCSLNICLNACTYRDMTKFYCGSQNEQDLYNLITVYLDMVFNPLFDQDESIFYQEGWRYEQQDEEVVYNGVVLNEMQTEFLEPLTMLEYELHQALFKETPYRYDSGGVPKEIVKLEKERLVHYHQQNYCLDNCTFFLYGDIEVKQVLALIDGIEQVKSPTYIKEDRTKLFQKSYVAPIIKKIEAPLGNGNEKSVLGMSFVVGEVLDTKLALAFEILEHLLLKNTASPIYRKLVEKERLGKALVPSTWEPLKAQPTFSFILQGVKKDKLKVFETQVKEILEELVIKGIEKNLLEAAFSHVAFGLKEKDVSDEPVGVVYSEKVQNSMRYGGEPFLYLRYEKILQELKQLADKGYFEKLIKTYLIENTHYAVIALEPNSLMEGLYMPPSLKTTPDLKEKAFEYQQYIADGQADRKDLQDVELPHITLGEIKQQAERLETQHTLLGDVPFYYTNEKAEGIVYMHLLFDVSGVDQERLSVLGLLVHLLSYVDTKVLKAHDLENIIHIETGGLNCQVQSYLKEEDHQGYQAYFKISYKVLEEKLEKIPEIIYWITQQSLFGNKNKIYQIIETVLEHIEKQFTQAPEYIACKNVYATLKTNGVFEEHLSGQLFYNWLKILHETFDQSFEQLQSDLEGICKQLFVANHMSIHALGGEKAFKTVEQVGSKILAFMPRRAQPTVDYNLVVNKKNELMIMDTNVSSVVIGFDFLKLGYQYQGDMEVVASIIENMYLWEEIRLKGGAYGAVLQVEKDGTILMCSYSDPNPGRTLEVFKGIGEFLESLELDEEELESCIMGVIGDIDIPISNMQKSERALARSVQNINQKTIDDYRRQILQVSFEDIKAYAKLFKEGVQQGNYCIVGKVNNRDKIDFDKYTHIM